MQSKYDDLFIRLEQARIALPDTLNEALDVIIESQSDVGVQELIAFLSQKAERYSTYTCT